MKDPFNPTHRLLRAVVKDEEAIALNAAAKVRSRRRRHRIICQGSLFATLLLGGAGILFLPPNRSAVFRNSSANESGKTSRNTVTAKAAFVRQYSTDLGTDEVLSASAASEEERKLLGEISDEPALIVWNDSGQVSRIHIFERRP
jgi:hypothetical protein